MASENYPELVVRVPRIKPVLLDFIGFSMLAALGLWALYVFNIAMPNTLLPALAVLLLSCSILINSFELRSYLAWGVSGACAVVPALFVVARKHNPIDLITSGLLGSN